MGGKQEDAEQRERELQVKELQREIHAMQERRRHGENIHIGLDGSLAAVDEDNTDAADRDV